MLGIINVLLCFVFIYSGLYIARDLGESGWSHNYLPVCDLETCADLGLTNDYLLNVASFGMDQDGMAFYYRCGKFLFTTSLQK